METSRPRALATPLWDSTRPARRPYPRSASAARDVASIATTSSVPSAGSASSVAPAPNAPVQATVTCHASPAKTSSPSQMTAQRTGDAVTAASSAPAA